MGRIPHRAVNLQDSEYNAFDWFVEQDHSVDIDGLTIGTDTALADFGFPAGSTLCVTLRAVERLELRSVCSPSEYIFDHGDLPRHATDPDILRSALTWADEQKAQKQKIHESWNIPAHEATAPLVQVMSSFHSSWSVLNLKKLQYRQRTLNEPRGPFWLGGVYRC